MVKDDYASAGGRGSLKLKGVKDSKIDKKKKKKSKKLNLEGEAGGKASASPAPANDEQAGSAKLVDEDGLLDDDVESELVGKTEAERRHAEMQRKRVSQALLMASEQDPSYCFKSVIFKSVKNLWLT
jgi:protein FAM32A